MGPQRTDHLRSLADRVLELSASRDNRDRRAQHERLFAPRSGARPLVFVRPVRPYVAERCGLSLKDAITDPATNLEIDLQTRISEATDFLDDTSIDPFIEIWPGVVFEAAMFGVGWLPRHDSQAWFGDPTLTDDEAIERFPEEAGGIDVESAGMVPLAKQFFDAAVEVVGDTFTIAFPRWYGGDLRTAQKLRGDTQLFLDFYDRPGALHSIMESVEGVRRRYDAFVSNRYGSRARTGAGFDDHSFSAYLRSGFILGDDEVDGNVISPDHYREFVLPYDRQFCGDRSDERIYFHSCGNLAPMLRDIATLPNLGVMHVSSLTDFAAATEVFGNSVVYEKVLSDWHPDFVGIAAGDLECARRYVEVGQRVGASFYFQTDAERSDERYRETARRWVQVLHRAIDEVYGAA